MVFLDEFSSAATGDEAKVLMRHRATLLQPAFPSWCEEITQDLASAPPGADGKREFALLLVRLAHQLTQIAMDDESLAPVADVARVAVYQMMQDRSYRMLLSAFLRVPPAHEEEFLLDRAGTFADRNWPGWLAVTLARPALRDLAVKLGNALKRVTTVRRRNLARLSSSSGAALRITPILRRKPATG